MRQLPVAVRASILKLLIERMGVRPATRAVGVSEASVPPGPSSGSSRRPNWWALPSRSVFIRTGDRANEDCQTISF